MSQLDTRIPMQVPNVLAEQAQISAMSAADQSTRNNLATQFRQDAIAPIARNALAAQTQGAELQNVAAERQILGQALSQFEQIPEGQRAAMWPKFVGDLAGKGVLDPQLAQIDYSPDILPEMWTMAAPPAAGEQYTLTPGSGRFDASGNLIASVPATQQPDKPTTSMREYALARQQGFDGTFADWKKQNKGGVTVNTGDGNLKLTEGQSKDLGFYTRGKYALDDLEGIDDNLTSLDESIMSQFGTLGNLYASPEYRQAKVAADEFLAVILRKDTGAAITDQEFDQYGSIYLPAPGDDAQTLQIKRDKRHRAINTIRLGLGTATPLADNVDAEFRKQKPIETWSTEEIEAEVKRLEAGQ